MCTAKKRVAFVVCVTLYFADQFTNKVNYVKVHLTIKLYLQWKVREINTTNKSRQTGSKQVFSYIFALFPFNWSSTANPCFLKHMIGISLTLLQKTRAQSIVSCHKQQLGMCVTNVCLWMAHCRDNS